MITRGDLKDHLYCLKTKSSKALMHALKDMTEEREDGSSSQGESSEAALWHRRFDHMSEKGLTYLMKDKALVDMKDVHLDTCEDCLAGKPHQVSFRNEQTMKTWKLEVIHSNVCGPMSVQLLSGHKYFVIFIDDATHKVWVCPIRTKDQVLEKFKELHTHIE